MLSIQGPSKRIFGGKMTSRKIYKTRASAIRAARNACKKALNSSIYQAYEGPDYAIHPERKDLDAPVITKRGALDLGKRWSFELRGPALEASR
jgi:hypothetical protein